jgi:hypothetical protein
MAETTIFPEWFEWQKLGQDTHVKLVGSLVLSDTVDGFEHYVMSMKKNVNNK